MFTLYQVQLKFLKNVVRGRNKCNIVVLQMKVNTNCLTGILKNNLYAIKHNQAYV